MAQPRKDSMDPREIETHHLWSRCVRRAYLLGLDPLTGKDYSYRREWLESLIEYQASVFAVDVGSYNILSNHFHEVLRNRPDVARNWSDEQVVTRWKMAWPEFTKGVWHCQPTDEAIEAVLLQAKQDDKLIGRIRANLCNLSWLQARIKQPFAWVVNRDESPQMRGHLWEQRYGNRRMDSPEETFTAILYGDLQQVQAGMVDSVEASDYSSIQRHIRTLAREAFEEVFDRAATDNDRDLSELDQLEAMFANCFLAPICDDGPLLGMPDKDVPATELILPAGYTFDPGPDVYADEESEPTEPPTESTSVGPEAANSGENTHNDRARPTGQGVGRRRRGRPRREHTYKILRRVRATQRRRASRNAILDMPWQQYYDLLKQLELQIVTRRRTGAAPEPVEPASSRGSGPPGSAQPHETPSTWRRQVIDFANWLQQAAAELPAHLAQRLRWSRGDPPAEPSG